MAGEITSGAQITADIDLSCDVCIVGSGAGGAVLAERLTAAGLDVVMLEEGPHVSRKDFTLLEKEAYPMLYQERGTRSSSDLGITILQGRSVGGSTTINWTTCYRTPDRILDHWQKHFGTELDAATLGPHWDSVEARLNISKWQLDPNPSNAVIARGCDALGWERKTITRNVNGCVNSGYCGLGCPVDGKQAMHITYIPDAVKQGLKLFADVRADRFEVEDGKVVAVHATVLERGYDARTTGRKVTIRPRVAVSSAGAINGPALLLRSGLDQGGRVGKRLFIHPVTGVIGFYEEPIDAWYGAPQSVASHQFIDRGPDDYGFFLEAAPQQPMLGASAARLIGSAFQDYLGQLGHMAAAIALHTDGLLEGDQGGTVTLRSDGRVNIDYPISERLKRGFKDSMHAMARIHLAAGALRAGTMHLDPVEISTEADLPKLDQAKYGAHEHTIFTAHQMGGCWMGADPDNSVVDLKLKFRGLDNLFVVDGSVLPTSLGVNPSQTIYGISHWASQHVIDAAS